MAVVAILQAQSTRDQRATSAKQRVITAAAVKQLQAAADRMVSHAKCMHPAGQTQATSADYDQSSACAMRSSVCSWSCAGLGPGIRLEQGQ